MLKVEKQQIQVISRSERRRKRPSWHLAFAGHCMSSSLTEVCGRKLLKCFVGRNRVTWVTLHLQSKVGNSSEKWRHTDVTWSWLHYPLIDLCCCFRIVSLPQSGPVTARGIYRREEKGVDDRSDEQIHSVYISSSIDLTGGCGWQHRNFTTVLLNAVF